MRGDSTASLQRRPLTQPRFRHFSSSKTPFFDNVVALVIETGYNERAAASVARQKGPS